MRKVSRRVRVVCLACIIVLVALWAGWVYWHAALGRQFRFGIYCKALNYYQDGFCVCPATLEDLEGFYNHVIGCSVLPFKDMERPVFRPVDVRCNVPCLVLIEGRPREWYFQWNRGVKYAYGYSNPDNCRDGQAALVPCSELERLIREDDARRASCCVEENPALKETPCGHEGGVQPNSP
jgi:hypothetical protein